MQYLRKLKSQINTLTLISAILAIPVFAQQASPPNGDPNSAPPGLRNPLPDREPRNPNRANNNLNFANVDQRLEQIIAERELEAIDVANFQTPDADTPMVQLGKQLFFAKNLGGEQSVACVSCHHPALGGADQLSLPVGINPVDINNTSNPHLLGNGRFNGASNNNFSLVPRNSPTVFNLVLNDNNMFWDGRVFRGRNSRIVTPDSAIADNGRRLADPNIPENATLAAAQARFPVTSVEEMRGSYAPDSDNQQLRDDLTTRFNNTDSEFTSTWPQAFELAFGDQQVTFDRIAHAIGEYERSMLFINSPWNDFLAGDEQALTEPKKRGAVIFFSRPNQGGAGCVNCHNGADFSDNRFHLAAFPQVGPGTGNNGGSDSNHDFGRENFSADTQDRYHFRTPSLLNVAATAPYGHAGAYQTLEQVVAHYTNPRRAIDDLFGAADGQPFVNDSELCELQQFIGIELKTGVSCQQLNSNAYANSIVVVEHLEQARNDQIDARAPLAANVRINGQQQQDLVAFLQALTDPCVTDRACLSPWILEPTEEANFPDENPLMATDQFGDNL